jgi:multicomponent Na+:H+ antiporter subunit E
MANNNSEKRNGPLAPIVVFVLLAAFWIPFSGMFDAFHLTLGVLCCAFVAIISHKLLFDDFSKGGKLKKTGRFILYIPWLIYQIVLSNIHVMKLVINPARVKPRVVRFKTVLKSDLSKVTLANYITLTPGTVTMHIIDGEFFVHALDQQVADDLLTGEMEKRTAHVFCED